MSRVGSWIRNGILERNYMRPIPTILNSFTGLLSAGMTAKAPFNTQPAIDVLRSKNAGDQTDTELYRVSGADGEVRDVAQVGSNKYNGLTVYLSQDLAGDTNANVARRFIDLAQVPEIESAAVMNQDPETGLFHFYALTKDATYAIPGVRRVEDAQEIANILGGAQILLVDAAALAEDTPLSDDE